MTKKLYQILLDLYHESHDVFMELSPETRNMFFLDLDLDAFLTLREQTAD